MVSKIYLYDIVFFILFSLILVIFLYKKRKNLEKEGLIYLYRTKIGIKLINKIGLGYKRIISVFGFFSVILGYFLMGSMIYILYRLIYISLFNPEIVQAIKVPPLMPLIPYIPEIFKITFLPPFYFSYWIIAIAVVAVFHEFSHGIVARRYGIKIKTTGFGFLGPFLAAFVEPDEKRMQKKSKYEQIAVLSAGTFSNFLLSIFFFLLLVGFFKFAYSPQGVIFNTYDFEKVDISKIEMIGNIKINQSNDKLIDIINKNEIRNDVVIGNFLNLTIIKANNKVYFIDIENLKKQLNTNSSIVVLYKNSSAINNGLIGVIIEIDNKKIKDSDDLAETLRKYKPGDEIKIKTKYKNEIYNYSIVLGEDPSKKGKAYLGIGYISTNRKGLFGWLSNFFNLFKKDGTNYEPIFNENFVIFIYNLIWWLSVINLSVALANMLPLGIFDGGRMFLLTVWAITGNKKFSEKILKIISYFILGAFLLLMLQWSFSIF